MGGLEGGDGEAPKIGTRVYGQSGGGVGGGKGGSGGGEMGCGGVEGV